jgi:cyclophilin family peptidyl-prolyl cis-trans isomerase
MNQTTWIVGGGVLILVVAIGLFLFTGGAGTKSAESLTDNTKSTVDQTTPTPIPSETKAVIKTSMGDITVKLYNTDAPKTVANFTKLAKEGFYDGVRFHRVIKDFMIQGGDPLSKDDTKMAAWGTGGPGYQFEDEINPHKLVRGSLAMANAGPGTNGSQFFIVTADATSWLDGKHTNFGEVILGMDIVEKINDVKTGTADRPVTPVTITSITVE